MDWTILVTTAVSLIGVLGGWESIKYLINRKSNKRIIDTEAKTSEFHLLQEMVEFLQKEQQEKEDRFVEQTQRLRMTQDELFKAKEAEYVARLELAQKKCEDQDCPFRRPPNALTPPKQGLTKKQYHENKAQ